MGIEPTNAGITIRCVNHFATTAIKIKMAGVVGLEPTLEVLETSVLPLNYTPKIYMVEGGGFEPPNPKERIYSPSRLATSLPLHIVNANKKKKISQFSKTNKKRWLRTESNRRHMDFQSIALPTELLSHILSHLLY